MTRFLVSLYLAVFCGLAGHNSQNTGDAQSGRLSIDIVAVDRKGEPVRDLTRDDLEVWIEHYRVPIRTLTIVEPQAGREPARLIVLLLDDVTISPAIVPRARDAAAEFVRKATANDRIMLATLSGAWSETSGEPAKLRRALEGYTVRATGFERPDVLSEHFLDTLASIAGQLTEVPGGRKLIVAIGSGTVLDRPLPPPGLGGRDVRPQWINAMRALMSAHMHLYVFDPVGVGAMPADGGKGGFANATGGHAFLNTNDSAGVVDRVMRDASNYYVLDVPDPPVGAKSDLRDLEVRVKRSGVTILAPRALPGKGERRR